MHRNKENLWLIFKGKCNPVYGCLADIAKAKAESSQQHSFMFFIDFSFHNDLLSSTTVHTTGASKGIAQWPWGSQK